MPAIVLCTLFHDSTSMLCPSRAGVYPPPFESRLDHATCSGQQLANMTQQRPEKCLHATYIPAARNPEASTGSSPDQPPGGRGLSYSGCHPRHVNEATLDHLDQPAPVKCSQTKRLTQPTDRIVRNKKLFF